ncbi:hypothetical protein CRG98_008704 [Punica granatum]|uniref:Uncharacterized protein n=1 Tax=Punica granatum TaxID=22663 RepID=A0A2I0KR07_PUNGR|nr:hypothetical protein CRG98_008704 [Punica granatum]
MTNNTSGSVPGASRISQDTPDLSRTPFLTGLPGPDPLTSKTAPQNGLTGTQGLPGSWKKLQTTFRNSTGFPEGRFSGSKGLPLSQAKPPSRGSTPSPGSTPQAATQPQLATANSHGRRLKKTTRYSGDHPTRLKPKITKLPSLHISHPLSPFPGLDFPFEASSITFGPHEESGPEATNRVQPCPNDVPFPPTTSSSRAITFKGFLTTLTLPSEEVVTIRGPIHRAQPPFHLFFLYWVPFPLPSFLSRFQACPGFGTFKTTHGRLDPSLRSPTSPIPHRVVAGASVPAHFPSSCRGCLPLGSLTRSL